MNRRPHPNKGKTRGITRVCYSIIAFKNERERKKERERRGEREREEREREREREREEMREREREREIVSEVRFHLPVSSH